MAIPLVGAAGAALLKLGGALKGAGAAKAASGLGMNAAYLKGGAAKTAMTGVQQNIKNAGISKIREMASLGGAQGISMDGVKRWAGNALTDYMGPGGMTAGNIAMNFGPDVLFGAMQGAMTPGDLGDKLIAGTTTAVGGAMGGVGAVSALGKFKNNPTARLMAEMGGGIAGDMVGQSFGDTVLRAKGGGTTPWEKVQQDSDQQYRQELERQILATYGLGGYNQTDLLGM